MQKDVPSIRIGIGKKVIEFVAVFMAAASFLILPQDALANDQGLTFVRGDSVAIPTNISDLSKVDFFYDGFLSNDFISKGKDGKYILKLPFPNAGGNFTLRITDKSTKSTVYEGNFKLVKGEFFDQVGFEGNVQADLVWKADSNSRPSPEGFNGRDVSFETRSNGTLTAVRDGWKASVNGEVISSDDGTKKLRTDGNKVDLSQGQIELAYKDVFKSAAISAGDVSMPGGVGLVNSGFSSRGVVSRFRTNGDGLVVEAGTVNGADIRGTVRGVEAFDREDRRSALNIGSKIYNSALINIEGKASVFDAIKPGAANFGFGEVVDGEENTVAGGELKIGLFEGRLNTDASFARSVYSNPAVLNTVNEFGNSVDVGTTTGNAYKYGAGWKMLSGNDYSVVSTARYKFVEPLFRSIVAGETADRESWDFGISGQYKFINFSHSKSIFDNNVDDISSILKTRQRSTSTSVSMDLEGFRSPSSGDAVSGASGGFSAIRLLPGNISLSRSVSAVETLNASIVGANSSLNGSELPNTVSTSYSLSLAWSWSFGQTSVSLSETQSDTRQEGRDTADTEDRSISISQSVNAGPFTISGDVSAGQADNNDTASLSESNRQSASLAIGYRTKKFPDVSTNFSASRSKDKNRVANNDSLTNSWSAAVKLDFSKFIPKFDEKFLPYLNTAFTYSENDVRNPNTSKSTSINYVYTVSAGFRF